MANLTVLTDDEPFDNIQRIASSAVIAPGDYWYCQESVEGIHEKREGSRFSFEAGSLYLLTRLEYFDGQLHSVVLLDDPASGTERGLLTLALLQQHFERRDNATAKRFREAQLAEIQGRVTAIQQEMAGALADPAVLQPVIEGELAKWEHEQAARAARAKQQAQDNYEGGAAEAPVAHLPAISRLSSSGRFDLTAAVTHRIGASDVAVFRHMALREGKIAEIRGTWIKNKVSDMARVLTQMAPFFSEHAAIGIARAHESLTLAEDVQKGLRSLRLYTGEGVTIETLATGASAPRDEPLTVFQRKLFMDEEFAVWTDVDRLFDYTHETEFFTALATNPSLQAQLIPAARGVLAMAVRRRNVDYSPKTIAAALEADARNTANKALFLLVRDGDNWHRVFSDEPSHELSPRLFPTRNEMDSIFQGLDGESIGFQDLRLTKRASEFDRKSLAYKRFLILACGLDHRKRLFGDFYPEGQALSFISQGFQKKFMRFVSDDDSDMMLGDSVGDVQQYIDHNHAQLVAGARLLVFGEELLQQCAAPGAFGKGRYTKDGTYYEKLVTSEHKALFLTVRRCKDDLVVDLPVQRINKVTYRGWQSKEIERPSFNVRVALNKLESEGLRYLVADIVSPDELRPYVYNRRSRAQHLNYLYGFKLAISHLEAEASATAGALRDLRERAEGVHCLAAALVGTAVRSAVQSWREHNSGERVLPRASDTTFKSLEAELAEVAYALNYALPAIEGQIAARGGELVRLMRGKRGALVAYYAQPEAERDLRIPDWEWVGRRVFSATGKPVSVAKQPQTFQSVWLPAGCILGEAELMRRPSPLLHPSPASRDLAKLTRSMDFVQDCTDALAGAFRGEHQGISDRAWLVLTHGKDAIAAIAGGRDSTLLLPLGVSTRGSGSGVVGVVVGLAPLLHFYGSDAQRGMLRQWQDAEAELRAKDFFNRSTKKPGVSAPVACTRLAFGSDRSAGAAKATLEQYHGGPWEASNSWNREDDQRMSLNACLAAFLASVPSKEESHWSSSRCMDPKEMWFPAGCFNEAGIPDIERYFPGYPAPEPTDG